MGLGLGSVSGARRTWEQKWGEPQRGGEGCGGLVGGTVYLLSISFHFAFAVSSNILQMCACLQAITLLVYWGHL